jgi:hypothetical protein
VILAVVRSCVEGNRGDESLNHQVGTDMLYCMKTPELLPGLLTNHLSSLAEVKMSFLPI